MKELMIFAFLVYLVNIPFGYWRAGTRRFSLNWYLAIHIPVPAIVFLRIFYDLGWTWQSYAVLVTSFFLGQFTGKLLRKFSGNFKIDRKRIVMGFRNKKPGQACS